MEERKGNIEMVRPSFIKSLEIDGEDGMTIRDWIIEIVCYNKFSMFLRRVGRFIARLFRWVPVLWNQEEWDFGYIYDILELKIKELRNSISKDTWHAEECVKEELEQIDSVLDHLDKYLNWPHYVDVPLPSEEHWVHNEDGTSTLYFSEEEHEAYAKASNFEEEHFKAFWDELAKFHSNWWT